LTHFPTILHLLGDFAPSGLNRRLLTLLPEMASGGKLGIAGRGKQVVAALRGAGLWEADFARAAQCAAVTRRPRDPLAFWRLARLMKHVNPAVVHHWGYAQPLLRGLCAWLAPRARQIVTCNNPREWPGAAGAPRWTWRGIETLVVENATLARFAEELPRTLRVVRIPPAAQQEDLIAPFAEHHERRGADARSTEKEFAAAELRARHNLPAGARILLTVGPLTRDKRIAELLWALDQIRCVLPEVYLLIVGDGPQRELIAKTARLYEIADRVRFVGAIEDVGPYYRGAEVYVCGDASSGPSQAVREALAECLPAAAIDSPALREALTHNHNALLARPAVRAELAQQILRILEEPGLGERLAKAGRETIRRVADWREIAAGYAGVYGDENECRAKASASMF